MSDPFYISVQVYGTPSFEEDSKVVDVNELPSLTFFTPEKRVKIGNYNSEFLYSLRGNENGGTFNTSTLIDNFNSEWSELQAGGTWNAITHSDTSNGTFIFQSLTSNSYSKYISSGLNWPRNIDIVNYIYIPSGDEINFFTCVKNISNFYRINVKNNTNSVDLKIYKTIENTETLISSNLDIDFEWESSDIIRVNIQVSYNKIGIYLGATDENFNNKKLEVFDDQIEFGSFGIGSSNSSIAFKGPFIRTLQKDNDGLIYKLPFSCYVQDQQGELFYISDVDKSDPLYIISGTGVGLNLSRSLSSSSIKSNIRLSTTSLLQFKFLFRTDKLRNYNIYSRVWQTSSGVSGFIFDFVDLNNFSYIKHTINSLNIYRVNNGNEELVISVGANFGISSSEFTDWQYIISDNLLEITRNGIEVYSNKPILWRGHTNWKTYGGKVGMLYEDQYSGWDEFEIFEFGEKLLVYNNFNNHDIFDENDISVLNGNAEFLVENRNLIGTALFLNNTNEDNHVFKLNNFIQETNKNKYQSDIYFNGTECGFVIGFGNIEFLIFSIISDTQVSIYSLSNFSDIPNQFFINSNNIGNFLNVWTKLKVEVFNTIVKFYINDNLIYGNNFSEDLIEGFFGLYSNQHIDDNTAFRNLEIFDFGREFVDIGDISNINESLKSTSNLIITHKQVQELITNSALLIQYQNSINSLGKINMPFLSSVIHSTGNLSVKLERILNSNASISVFATNFIVNTEYSRNDWTNISTQTFYSTLNGGNVEYYKYKVTTNINDETFDDEDWDGTNVEITIGEENTEWYFIAYAYDFSDTLVGKDIFVLNYDTVSPVVYGAHIIENPIYENQDINIAISMLTNNVGDVEFKLFKNGILYKTQTEYDKLSSLFVENNFAIDDKLDVLVTAFDKAGNGHYAEAGYNYGGDENGNGPLKYSVIQRYYYKINIWHGTYSEEQVNGKYCPNIGLELQKTRDCPVAESEILFLPNSQKECPHCHYPLTLGEFKPDKKIFETNIPKGIPVREDPFDQLAILRLGISHTYKYNSDKWLFRLEERETPYKKDILNLGNFDISSHNNIIHFEIQISKSSNFLNENIIYSEDSFTNNTEFEYYSNLMNGWVAVSSNGIKNINNASLRYKIPIEMEINKTFYYRWRVIEVNSSRLRNYKEWLPAPIGFNNFEIEKFTTPTEDWDGSYREFLLQDNYGFNGFYNEDNLLNSYNVGILSITEYDKVCRIHKEEDKDSIFLAINSTEEVSDNDIQNCIMKLKVRSNSLLTLNPFILLEDNTQVILSTENFNIDAINEWKIFEIDFSQLSVWGTLNNKIKFGFTSNLTMFSELTYIDVDFIALLKKVPTFNKKYYYPHVKSSKTRCVFEQKQENLDIFKADGFCTKLHTPGVFWKGTWNSSISYKSNDGIIYDGSQYVAMFDIVPNIIPSSNPDQWRLLGTDLSMDTDGFYEGGSLEQNPNTTGYCKNTICPDYAGYPEIDENIEIIFDLNSNPDIENINGFESDQSSGLLLCPNTKKNLDGSPQCRNNFHKITLPPYRKICSRHEGVKVLNWSFDYICNKFSRSNKNRRYDNTGADAEISEGITKIPADVKSYYNEGTFEYEDYYEAVQPDHHYWSYEDLSTTCDGFLRKSDNTTPTEICGAPLVGFSEGQTCSDCGTLLIPLNLTNDIVQALKCNNNNKSIKIIPKCNKGINHDTFISSVIRCPESNDILIRFNVTPILSFVTSFRQLVLEDENLILVADGLPKTWAHSGWDILLNQPYSGQIRGDSGHITTGLWEGVTNIKWLKATEKEFIDWQNKLQIASNLIDRVSNENILIDNYKDLHIKKQWEKNIKSGDHYVLYRKPGNYVDFYNIDLNEDLYYENVEFLDNKLVTKNTDSFLYTKLIINPNLRGDQFFGIEFEFNLEVLSSISNEEEVLELGLSKLLSEININTEDVDTTEKNEIKHSFMFKKRILSSNHYLDIYAISLDDEISLNNSHLLMSININTLPNNKFINCFIKIYNTQIDFIITEDTTSESYSWNIGPSSVIISDKYIGFLKQSNSNINTTIDFIRIYQPEILKADLFANPDYFIKTKILLSNPGTSIIDESDQFKIYNHQYATSEEWTETYYKIEFDPLPTFTSHRGKPMRSIIGKGYTCLNKSPLNAIASPDGFAGADFCEKYKFVWSKEDAENMNYKCPACKNKLYLNRFDSTLLSLTTSGNDRKTPNLSPKIIHQLLDNELPGLSDEDYLLKDFNNDGELDHITFTNNIKNKFFINDSLDVNSLPNNWIEKKMAILIPLADWNDPKYVPMLDNWMNMGIDFSNWSVINNDPYGNPKDISQDLLIFEQKTMKSSLYSDRDIIKEGNIVEQRIKTEFGMGYDPVYETNHYRLERYWNRCGLYSIGLCQEVDLSSMSPSDKKSIFGDFRFSAFFPTAGFHWSPIENYYSYDSVNVSPHSATRKIASVQFQLNNNLGESIGVFHVVLIDSCYDYYDYFNEFEYSYPANSWVYFHRNKKLDEKDKWNFYKLPIYDLISVPLSGLSMSWNDVSSVEVRLCTTVIRAQVSFTSSEWPYYNSISSQPNFAVTLWGHCSQGYEFITENSDSSKLKFSPIVWNGEYYYRIVPYSFKLNDQWLNWYKSKAAGWGTNFDEKKWKTEHLVHQGGMPPKKWMYKENDPILTGMFKYSFDWETIYRGEDHVILPKSLE